MFRKDSQLHLTRHKMNMSMEYVYIQMMSKERYELFVFSSVNSFNTPRQSMLSAL